MSATIASAFHDIRRAILKLEVAKKGFKHGPGKMLLIGYLTKLNWVLDSFVTCCLWSDSLRDAIRKDMASDPLTSEAIFEKIDYLAPNDREMVEDLIDRLISERKENALK
jgi:hypothetical protein